MFQSVLTRKATVRTTVAVFARIIQNGQVNTAKSFAISVGLRTLEEQVSLCVTQKNQSAESTLKQSPICTCNRKSQKKDCRNNTFYTCQNRKNDSNTCHVYLNGLFVFSFLLVFRQKLSESLYCVLLYISPT